MDTRVIPIKCRSASAIERKLCALNRSMAGAASGQSSL